MPTLPLALAAVEVLLAGGAGMGEGFGDVRVGRIVPVRIAAAAVEG